MPVPLCVWLRCVLSAQEDPMAALRKVSAERLQANQQAEQGQ
jgi:hypothetical protein|eukprot:COSAG06_NODE_8703_length_2092_cov_3.219769_2_plen_42_part_00